MVRIKRKEVRLANRGVLNKGFARAQVRRKGVLPIDEAGLSPHGQTHPTAGAAPVSQHLSAKHSCFHSDGVSWGARPTRGDSTAGGHARRDGEVSRGGVTPGAGAALRVVFLKGRVFFSTQGLPWSHHKAKGWRNKTCLGGTRWGNSRDGVGEEKADGGGVSIFPQGEPGSCGPSEQGSLPWRESSHPKAGRALFSPQGSHHLASPPATPSPQLLPSRCRPRHSCVPSPARKHAGWEEDAEEDAAALSSPCHAPSPLLPQLLPRHKQTAAMAGPSFPTDKPEAWWGWRGCLILGS